MESPSITEDTDVPEAQLDADYYYMKALNYLAASSSENIQSDSDSCGCPLCPSSEDKDDDHFTLGFRRGLARDHDELHSTGSSSSSISSSSPRGSDAPTSHPHPTAAAASSHTPASPKRRERKYSLGGRFYKTGSSEFGKLEPKRKLSDGHVHWADEFQKELTRSHPRKSYSRHPSHLSSQVKPILKVSQEDIGQC